jgi:WD40 repeat protein/tetratricopeptide (TPR) repeat protein
MNPFPGLRPFSQEEDYLFFGREEQTMELLQRLGGNRFVAVVGTSGSGKSSLVRCGLLSQLLGGKMLEAGASWEIAVTHPGGNPLALLTDALLEADLYDREGENARENLLATLSRSHFGLVEAVKQADPGAGTNFLLVVDQFEEIFRFHEAGQTQQEVANEFVSLLLEAAAQKEVPIYVVLTMRSDFIGECGQFEGLAEMVNRGEFLIPRLNREQYKRAIEGPIKVAGGQIAPRLLQRLLNDLGQQADQLPCLQHALMRTWNVWSEKGDSGALDLDDYQRVGKMSLALSLHADEIYESLAGDRQRELCQGIFQALTVEESNSRGIRRPQRLGRLCQILEAPAGELRPIIDAYRQSGVTFLMPSPEVELTHQTIIDISHESLMRVWTRLRQWVEEETQAAGIYHRLSESADLHERGKAGLYRDPELGIALAWRESKRPNAAWAERYRPGFATAIKFLEASQQASVAEEESRQAARQRELEQAQQLAEAQQLRLEHQQRSARKLRMMIGGLAAVAVIAILACALALFANQRAITLAAAARQNEERARQNEEKANQNATRAEQSQQETAKALAVVASQKAQVEGSLSKAETAERLARTAEEAGRKLLYTTDMRLAPFVWRDDRTTAEQLRVLLAKHIPSGRMKDEGGGMNLTGHEPGLSSFILHPSSLDLRGFEWHYYQHVLQESAAVFSGHDGSVVDGAFTANGLLVTLDQNGQLRRWDLSSQAEDEASRRDLPGGPGAQFHVLSPNGRLAALAEGNKVHVFDASTGDETFQFDSANTPFRHLVFSRGGDRLVIVDDKIRWCSALNGEVMASVNQKFERVQSLALSGDGMTLAVVGHGRSGQLISIFRLDATAKTVTPLSKDFGIGGTLLASASSPDGQRIAVGAALAGALFVYDTAPGRSIAQHGSAHASPIAAMAFSGDGTKLATADAEGTIKIWADPQKLSSNSTALLTLKGHQGAINRVGFSIDGKRLITTSADKTARVWDLENAGAAIRPLEAPSHDRSLVARFSPDGQLIAAATGSSLRLWDAATGRIVRELSTGDKGRVASVAFSPTDHRMLAVGYGGEANVSYVALWDIDAGTELGRLPGATDLPNFPVDANNGVVGVLRFSPDGKYLVAGFGSKTLLSGGEFSTPLKVWEVATRRVIRHLNGHTNYCVSLDFSRDGTLLASGSRDGTAILWSTATWKATRTLQNPDEDSVFRQNGRGMVEDVAFSPDGKTLAMASREANVHLWDVATGKLLETLKGHSSAVLAVVFSPDGRTLASGGSDQTVRLWNVETRRELMQLDPGDVELGHVQSLAFSPDGQQLLAGGSRTAMWSTAPNVWNDPGRAAEKLRMLLKSNADFPSRIRMLSENLRLHEALAKLDAKDKRVQAALAATQANWHASRKAWKEAALAFDRLVAADPTSPNGWLRTPGLLRLATALVHENRPSVAATLLQGGAKRRTADGIAPAALRVSIGVTTSTAGGQVRVNELLTGSPASRTDLLPGDVILKVNDIELTGDSVEKLDGLLAGEAGTKVRLTVRHSGSEKPAVIELTRERFLSDPATGELLYTVRALVNERLAKKPRDARLLELRAELAGQWSSSEARVADYSAALEALAHQTPEATIDLKRLYRRRGNAYVSLKKWAAALDDYAHVVTATTTDEDLLTSQATALAESMLTAARWTVLKPVKARSELGASLSILPDDSILVSGAHRWKDRYRVELTLGTEIKLTAVRLEALAHDSLPNHGPGRGPEGTFAQISWSVTATPPAGKEPITLKFDNAWADHQLAGYPIDENGHWNIYGGRGGNCTAIWSMSKPVSWPAGTTLTFEMQCQTGGVGAENIGHFRLSVSSDPAALDRERIFLAATKLTDPWEKLAAAYQLEGDGQAIDRLIERRPKLAAPIGDLFTQGKDEDKDWRRAIALYSKRITEKTTDALLLSKRALAHEALKNWDSAAADWSRAATGNPDGAKLLADFARRLAAAGQVPLANAQFEKAQEVYERLLQADSESDLVAAELAQTFSDEQENRNTARWRVLKPKEMKSQGGATLTELEDHSILAGGVNPRPDQNTIRFIIPERMDLRSIRLQALTHDSLPGHGPGRGTNGAAPGWFQLSRWDVTAKGPGSADSPRPLSFQAACADYSWNDAPLGLPGHWNITRGGGENRTSVWRLSVPITLEAGTELVSQMRFNELPDWSDQNLGRFRLSVSSDPAAFDWEQTHFAVMKLTDPWTKLADAYAINGRNGDASRYFDTALERADGYEARKPIVELAARFDEVLSALIKRQPDDPQLQLALARNLAERGKRDLAEKLPAKAQAELEKSREIFARLSSRSGHWAVPTPVEMKAESGARLELLKDGSVFVHQQQPAKNDTYSVEFQSELKGITGLRLEVLADSRLPQGGPGWAQNGNFALNELTLHAAPAGTPDSARAIPLRIASADFSQAGWDVRGVIDNIRGTGWGVVPELNKDHAALFELAEPVGDDKLSRLTVRLEQRYEVRDHNVGRFRLSFTNDATTLPAARARLDLKDSEVADVIVALARAQAQQGRSDEAVASFAEALALAGDRAGKARIIAEASPLEGVLAKLAERATGDARFQAELARYSAEHGNAALADAARTKARQLLEQKLAQEPENTVWAMELAELLLPPIGANATMMVPTSENEAISWRFSTKEPPADWMGEAFDDSAWTTSPGAFGSNGSAPGLVMRTEWKTSDIWLRRRFEWKPDPAVQTLLPRVIHDDGFELFINGQQVLSRQDATTAYNIYPVDAKALSLLKPGTNRIAVHCHSTLGAQYIDVGLLGVSSNPHVTQQRLTALKMTDPCAKLAAAYHVIGDQPALDRLLQHRPAAAIGIGDLYAAQQDWKRALAEYDKAITSGSKDARTFAARALVHEKLEHWELAAADWGNADLHASDKTVRYGDYPRPAMERRAEIHQRLQQYEKVVLDCNELLKPERLGNHPWIFLKRGEAYDQLRQWQKAWEDYDRAIKLSQPAERGSFHFYRARHFAAGGQWKPAVDDLHQAYEKPTDFLDASFPRREWWALRDAALVFAIAGDVENYDKAVARWYRKQSAGTPDAEESKWTVLTMVLLPEMITKENRTRLLEMAGTTDAYWRPRLTAAIHFRSGDYKKAVELLDANGGGAQFFFLAAMTHYKLGNQDRAKQLLDEGDAWIQEQRAKDPGAGIPRPHDWHEWAFVVALHHEAHELILGPRVGSGKLPEPAVGEAQFQAALARHYFERGNAQAADAARERACTLFAEKLAQDPENTAFAAGVLSAYQSAGRTREAVPLLAKASAANPKDTILSLNVAALQAWFGQEKELAATRQRILAFAKGTTLSIMAERAAKACSILPSIDKAEVEAALALGRSAMKPGNGVECWNLLALGMSEYRSGNHAAAEKALLAAVESVKNIPGEAPGVTGISSFFRAMSLFRLGKKDEPRELATAAAAKMKPLPADERNPLADNVTDNDLILWLAYKEAKAMIRFDAVPPPQAEHDKRVLDEAGRPSHGRLE